MRRTAIYVRVSTAKQEDGTSLTTQLESCRRYCVDHGLTVSESHVYQEVFTGTELWERPQLQRLREAIRRQEVDAIVCYAIDRLARDPIHLGVILSEADHKGVTVSFVTEVIDDTPEGQLVRFVRGYAAKVEHEKIRERTIRGKRGVLTSFRVENGIQKPGRIHNHGPELYGYRRDKDAGVRVIYEPEAVIVRRIYSDYLTGGLGLRAIAIRLNADGVPSPHASLTFKDGHTPVWREKSIRDIIANPAYRGETHGWRYRGSGLKRGYVIRDPSEWIALEGVTPAIIAPEVWEASQERLKANRGSATRVRRTGFFLRGMVRCGTCGRMCYPELQHGHRRYRCSSRHLDGIHCGAPGTKANELEAWVWEQACDVIQHTVTTGSLTLLDTMAAEGLDDQLTTLRAAVARITKSQERVLAQFANSESIPWDLVERQVAKGEREKEAVQTEIAGLEARIRADAATQREHQEVVTWAATIVQRLGEMTEDERRATLEMLKIEVAVKGWDWRLVPAVRGDLFTT